MKSIQSQDILLVQDLLDVLVTTEICWLLKIKELLFEEECRSLPTKLYDRRFLVISSHVVVLFLTSWMQKYYFIFYKDANIGKISSSYARKIEKVLWLISYYVNIILKLCGAEIHKGLQKEIKTNPRIMLDCKSSCSYIFVVVLK